MNRRLKQIIRMGVTLVLGAALICGCSRQSGQTVPELVEPAAVNSAYRPVEYGNIGNVQTLSVNVVPMKYCNFYNTSVYVASVAVEVGQYVNEGDVLAYADLERTQQQLDGAKESLDYENQTYALNKKISDATLAKLESSDEDNTVAINTEKENASYDLKLHDYRVGKLNEDIAALQKVITEGSLVANHSGYVCYIKDIGSNPNAGASECIVMVADMNDTYLEAAINVNEYKYKDYEVQYLVKDGQHYDIEQLEYTPEELILSKALSKYPRLRFTCPDAGTLTIGNSYQLVFIQSDISNVLIVGNDSVYEENGEKFVYVKTDKSDKEKRIIEAGSKDKNYTQVKSGLEEGDLVYYESSSIMPVDYEEYTVELSDYSIENHCFNYTLANAFTFKYASEYEGTVSEIAVTKKAEVKKGDLLYVIDTGEGKAAMTEAQYAIDGENISFAQTEKDYNEQLAATEDANDRIILTSRFEIAKLNHVNSLKQLQESYDNVVKNNDGTGKMSVYAQQDGEIDSIYVTEGTPVSIGKNILAIDVKGSQKLLFQLVDNDGGKVFLDNIADLGETMTVEVGDVTYTAKCTGFNVLGSANVVYPYTKGDKTYLSYCQTSGLENESFYAELDDTSLYSVLPKGQKFTFDYVARENTIAIPLSMVNTDSTQSAGDNNFYVWKIVEDQLVKQYVGVDTSLMQYDYGQVVVISGLKAGDVLAKEK